MENAVANIIEDACKKSNLYGQIKTLMQMKKLMEEKLSLIHI